MKTNNLFSSFIDKKAGGDIIHEKLPKLQTQVNKTV